MARSYAGILGYLAVTLVLIHGIGSVHDPSSTINQAVVALVLFTIAGFIVGWIAEVTIDEAVRTKLERELAMNPPLAVETKAKRVLDAA